MQELNKIIRGKIENSLACCQCEWAFRNLAKILRKNCGKVRVCLRCWGGGEQRGCLDISRLKMRNLDIL